MSWKAKPSATTDPVSLDVLADLEKPAGGSFVTDALRSRWTAEIIPKYATNSLCAISIRESSIDIHS